MQEESTLKIKALKQITEWIPAWKSLNETDLSITRLTGITNRTYRVKHEKAEIQPQILLLRVFGHDVDGIFIDREQETKIYEQVGANKLGPNIYGYTNEMRAEQWIDSRVLQAGEMREKYYRRKVAFILNKFHKQNIKDITKEPMPLQLFNNRVSLNAALDKFKDKKDIFTGEEYKKLEEILNYWTDPKEIEFIKSKLPKNENSIVFSHNDLLANNILLNSDKKFFFIDFEYSCYNYRIFDIGNYLMESIIDYDHKEPPFFKQDPNPIPLEVMEDIIRFYAFKQLYEVSEEDEEKVINDENEFNSRIKNKQEYENLVKEMMEELPIQLMLSNYFWGIWGVVMSKNPEIDFDYVEFSYLKFQIYLEIKKRFFGDE